MMQWPLSTETLASLEKAKLREPPNYPLYWRMRSKLSSYCWGSLCGITVSRKDQDQLPGGNLICLDSSPLKPYPP